MTKQEKQEVLDLRLHGCGYRDIAELLKLPPNTVKSYLFRHPVTEEELERARNTCRQCGVPIEQLPHRRRKQFCSDKCRMAWWNAHQERVQRRAWYSLTCGQCGREFRSYGNDHRKFCCRDCYAAYRRKEATPNG